MENLDCLVLGFPPGYLCPNVTDIGVKVGLHVRKNKETEKRRKELRKKKKNVVNNVPRRQRVLDHPGRVGSACGRAWSRKHFRTTIDALHDGVMSRRFSGFVMHDSINLFITTEVRNNVHFV